MLTTHVFSSFPIRTLLGGLLLVAGAGLGLAPPVAQAQVQSSQKISNAKGNFGGTLDGNEQFGASTATLPDMNGDGVPEMAVGARGDADGGSATSPPGAVWILFLNGDGTVQTEQKISDTEGSFTGTLDEGDFFGQSVAHVGDLDGDGVPDLAVGARDDDDGGFGSFADKGAVWILFLNSDGTVSSHTKISDTQGGFGGSIATSSSFGSALSLLGDLDGNGTPELAVGNFGADDSRGAVWILSLQNDGTVADEQKIAEGTGGFDGSLDSGDPAQGDFPDLFGDSVARVGDLDGNGVPELAVGATGDDDGGTNRGTVWVLFLKGDGTVADEQKISDTAGSFEGTLSDNDEFGHSAAQVGDLNGDGTPDLLAGAPTPQTVWVLYLNGNGTVAGQQAINGPNGGFGTVESDDAFGRSLTSFDDLDGNGVLDPVVGNPGDDDGGGTATETGAVRTLFGSQGLLPVELASFDARQTGERAVRLTWTTASETNNAGFRVQHQSTRSTSWKRVGFVEGQGTTDQPQRYRFETEDLAVGSHQFRLKQVDLDGTTTAYDPVTVDLQMQEALRLSAPAPNPVQDRATLSFAVKDPAETTITLYNALGQRVRTLYRDTPTPGEAQTARVSTDGLSSGVYFLRLRADGQTKTERVTVVR